MGARAAASAALRFDQDRWIDGVLAIYADVLRAPRAADLREGASPMAPAAGGEGG